MFNFYCVIACSFFLQFFLTSFCQQLSIHNNISDIHSSKRFTLNHDPYSWPSSLIFQCDFEERQQHHANKFVHELFLDCQIYIEYLYFIQCFCCYGWQDSQQRIVVMKKESERLSQEVNQMDTNKLGKLLSLTYSSTPSY